MKAYYTMIDEEKQRRAEEQLLNSRLNFSWGLREWGIDMIVSKMTDGVDADGNIQPSELFIPDYQRDYKWEDKVASRFIESILLGFPIPYLYVATVEDFENQEEDGRLELIDGSQRVRALCYFVNDELVLTELKQLSELEGFKFSDLAPGRRRRFLRETLRFMELTCDSQGDFRRDLFERINSGNITLNPMEVRRGSEGALSDFYQEVINVCAQNPLFLELAPFSSTKNANRDREELVLRFFAYSDMLDSYNGNVRKFLDEYLHLKAEEQILDFKVYLNRFQNMLDFVKENFPYGFRKTAASKTTFRTYFESISLGVHFALQEKEDIKVNSLNWLNSTEYKVIIASDAANNTAKVKARIEYVQKKLVEG